MSHSVDVYAAECCVELGAWPQAERHARAALGVGRWSPGREVGAHLSLGTALANLGSPEEAIENGRRAIALCHDNGGTTILQKASRLDGALISRYPKDASVMEFHEDYRQHAGRAVTS